MVTPSFAPDRKSLSTGRFQFIDLTPDLDDSCGTRFAQTVLAITNQGKICSLQPESKTMFSELRVDDGVLVRVDKVKTSSFHKYTCIPNYR